MTKKTGLWGLAFLFFIIACSKPSPPPKQEQRPVNPPPEIKAPKDEGPFGPSLVHIENKPEKTNIKGIANVCGACHVEQKTNWQQSMHAFSSFNNPFYRFNFDHFVKEKGFDKGVFCAGCHDPAPLISGEIKKEMAPDATSGHVGVNCVACHHIQSARHDGNGSYTVSGESLLLPQPDNDLSLQKHKTQMSKAKNMGTVLCVSCHRGFLSPLTGHDLFIPALEDWKPFRQSGYNRQKARRVDEPVDNNECISCHMPLIKSKDGKSIHDHGFMGGHTAFAQIANLPHQKEKQTNLLKSGAKLFVPLAGFNKEKGKTLHQALKWEKADQIYFDAVVWNHNTGHSFPGGAKDIKDTWLEVQVFNENGDLVAENGVSHEKNKDDFEAHRLGVLVINKKGQPVPNHQVAHFRTAAFNHTIGPRDARVIRYALSLKEHPQIAGQKLSVQVRLRHRRLMPDFFQAACDAAQTPRGRAFINATEKKTGIGIRPCTPQPIIDLHTKKFVWVTNSSQENPPIVTEALWAHGLGMLHALNEKIFLARHSFDLAADHAKSLNMEKAWRDRLLWAQATVSAQQGRSNEAIGLFQKGLQTNLDHPALLYGVAQAHIKTWRFKEAIPYLEKAIRQAPQDIRIAIALARSYSSEKQYEKALQTAQNALEVEPRDPHLLRLQAIAIEKMYPKTKVAQKAKAVFLSYKRDELAPAIQGKCQDKSAFCKRERLGFHTHQLNGVKTP